MNKIDELFENIKLNEKVNVRGIKREEASPDPSRVEKDGNKVTKEYKKEIQDQVDKNTEKLLKEIDDLIDSYETFRNKFKKVVGEEGSRRRQEGAARFGGRWSKLTSMYSKVEDMVLKLQNLKFNR